ncbi:MAG TPA: nucleotidyltransferase domain-containing protein [Longimicrobiaceae bacterium]|nr:nucleotidyltransferase domain-containing protein [Longimicrobiaceae bacterium]
MSARPTVRECLSPREHAAAMEFVRRVRREVPAELVRALLFGSRARGDARPDSDLDVLLVFRDLPPDREPHAGHAETIAAAVAFDRGVPVTTWCVSLPDLEQGRRTPMLVDALDDGVPLWPPRAPPLRIAWTPHDALACVGALLQRVEEGSEEVGEARARGDAAAAVRRARDDVVRLCTAALLLEGETRPRRGEAVLRFAERFDGAVRLPREGREVLAWAAVSYGPPGAEDEAPVPPPPAAYPVVGRVVDALRAYVAARHGALEAEIARG